VKRKKMNKIKRRSAIVVITGILLFGVLSLSAVGIGSADDEQIGILVMAHGSPSESWCAPVREVVENVSPGYPTEVGYLEFVEELEGYNFIHEAVEKLDEKGVTKIIAVPLFISSSSGHIAEIEYVLGLREDLPGYGMAPMRTFVEGVEMERSIKSRNGRYFVSYTPISDGVSASAGHDEEEELVPVDTSAEIILTNAMDDHWAVAQILADRAAEVCENPESETVVFVSHGEFETTYFEGWINSSESLAEKIKLILRHSKGINIEDVRYSFVYQPEDYPTDLTVRAVVEDVSATSYPIVVPRMISEGFFTGMYIPTMLLAGLDYGYPEEGQRALTPHPTVTEWIEVTAAKELTYPAVLIYDDSELLEITLDEVGAYHGKICPCVAIAFRSTLRAFSEEALWDGIPVRGDVKIICAHPSDGHQMTFEYILESEEDVVIQPPAGTDIINITADNYDYTFIRKSTGNSIELAVMEEVFPERFFELRTKKKLGTATGEEKKAFKLLWEELKEKFMYLHMDRIFEVVPPEPMVSISTDKTTYQPGDTMIVTVNLANPVDTAQTALFSWYLEIPAYSYQRPVVSHKRVTLSAGCDYSIPISIPVGYLGATEFNAVWLVELQDPTTFVTISSDTAEWTYALVPPVDAVVQEGEMTPANIAEEITKTIEIEIEEVGLPI